MNTENSSVIMKTLAGHQTRRPPIWMMRQAGRYLPEYRELRTRAPTFLEFCYTPKLAVEATLQPLKRFELDAAILFSDILVIPDALGQKVTFETGEGPRLDPINASEGIKNLDSTLNLSRLAPVFETIQIVRGQLSRETALIGFCGAPWTVASYMIAGKGTPDQAPARIFAYRFPEIFNALIELLTDASIAYLSKQIESGVDVVQIFDSWSGVLPAWEFEKWCHAPLKKIVTAIHDNYPDVPIIAFPRGAGSHLPKIARMTGLNAIGLDTAVDPLWAAREVQSILPVQGNLDPLALLTGGKCLSESVNSIISIFGDGPHIFNLGHGILPQTPIEHVEQLVKQVRNSG